jgi:hypothetical protein
MTGNFVRGAFRRSHYSVPRSGKSRFNRCLKVAHASRKAYRLGLVDRCRFEQADVRNEVESARSYNLVSPLSLGPEFGNPAETVGFLRNCVVPGGYILIDDGYLRTAEKIVPGYEDYYDQESTLRFLRSHGDRWVKDY